MKKRSKRSSPRVGRTPRCDLPGIGPPCAGRIGLAACHKSVYLRQSSRGALAEGAAEDRVEQQAERSMRLRTILDGES